MLVMVMTKMMTMILMKTSAAKHFLIRDFGIIVISF